MVQFLKKKGNLKLGLIIGLAGFSFFATTSIPAAQYLFQGQNLTLGRVIAWLPWIIPIVLLNGIREELLYRGLFLKKLEPKLGLKASNLLQAIIFSLSHSVAGVGLNAYTPYISILVIFTFSLGLAWGYIMQRTDSIIGSTLFHAGTEHSYLHRNFLKYLLTQVFCKYDSLEFRFRINNSYKPRIITLW